ncbi:MAG: dehypoxanthine futalosine cyclase [Proteobacteria bacterium]|nr:dehypoxanthine futalosine cyclase [Pseudomonadota bacterium]MBU1740305.1 dehypoxanthine futalosine cyclase [Pseudomonadota bacterium]
MRDLLDRAASGERLGRDQALTLFQEADLLDLAAAADAVRWRLHPAPRVTYVVDRNINYTNICQSGCLFCAFYKKPGDPAGYVLSWEELDQKIEQTVALGGRQVLLQGGLNPELDLGFYRELLQRITARHSIHVHGFSPPEIVWLAGRTGCSVERVLRELVAAGLGSIPGGGAEILVDEVRRKISPEKCTAAEWLAVMRLAHFSGLRTTATMMFGHVERDEHRVEHLIKIRELQDETNGFTAFIPWTFQPENTRLAASKATAVEYLRTLTLCRLVLDNVPHIQASWVTQGAKIAQAALAFGADDLGSTMIEENVVAAAGVSFRLSEADLIHLIESAGLMARRRDCFYNLLLDRPAAAGQGGG